MSDLVNKSSIKFIIGFIAILAVSFGILMMTNALIEKQNPYDKPEATVRSSASNDCLTQVEC